MVVLEFHIVVSDNMDYQHIPAHTLDYNSSSLDIEYLHIAYTYVVVDGVEYVVAYGVAGCNIDWVVYGGVEYAVVVAVVALAVVVADDDMN